MSKQQGPATPQTGNALNALGFGTLNPMTNPQAQVQQRGGSMSVGNPNVASGSSSTPQMLSTVGRGDAIPVYDGIDRVGQKQKSVSAPYRNANAERVGKSPTKCYGTGNLVQGQAPMTHKGGYPSFEQLAPKSMSTRPGPMGTDYKK